ncbi:MAG TPA: DUF692 family protein [Thermoanaerobaculia bacterium]|nr:DUF692 family protein [Thermoanaerobaculia bacterium]
MRDLFGLGWRFPLAGRILAAVDRLDVVEVIAEDWTERPARQQHALRTLSAQIPVVLHGVSLGLASSVPVDEKRLDAFARVVDLARPAFWSEHLAFVRGGGIEIGHLAAPPRCAATIEGTVRNVARARAVVGSAPLLENVATLIDPPGSDRDEAAFVSEVLEACDTDLLLDLHNLHANARNFCFGEEGEKEEEKEEEDFLRRVPMRRVRAVHLAGGRPIPVPRGRGETRLLDDHLHPVPDVVFSLLERVGAMAPPPLTVILERDGLFPPFEELLNELERARTGLAAGRARREVAA